MDLYGFSRNYMYCELHSNNECYIIIAACKIVNPRVGLQEMIRHGMQ